MGDFFQLEPVGSPLYKSDMLVGYDAINFNVQMRAQEDIQHTKILDSFRDLSKTTKPFTKQHFANLKVITPNDMVNPQWKFAPIVVTNNAERHVINEFKIKEFALYKNLPIIAWHLPLSRKVDDVFSNDLTARNFLYQKCPELTCYFEQGNHLFLKLFNLKPFLHFSYFLGAPIYITQNICHCKGYCKWNKSGTVFINTQSVSRKLLVPIQCCKTGRNLDAEFNAFVGQC